VQNELGIQNKKLNKNLSFHVEKVQLLYDSNHFHSQYILTLRISSSNQGTVTKGGNDCLCLLSPGGIRIEHTNCGGERLPCNQLYVSSITFMSVTV